VRNSSEQRAALPQAAERRCSLCSRALPGVGAAGGGAAGPPLPTAVRPRRGVQRALPRSNRTGAAHSEAHRGVFVRNSPAVLHCELHRPSARAAHLLAPLLLLPCIRPGLPTHPDSLLRAVGTRRRRRVGAALDVGDELPPRPGHEDAQVTRMPRSRGCPGHEDAKGRAQGGRPGLVADRQPPSHLSPRGAGGGGARGARADTGGGAVLGCRRGGGG